MISLADKDGDGRINFDEFCRLFITNYKAPPPSHNQVMRSMSPPQHVERPTLSYGDGFDKSGSGRGSGVVLTPS